ncbi:MAG: GAF domain-containing protein [Ktedonobacteraceae bacterium]|nr:GAF domain-containing protein [Ktedonobacteraceae bacterium]
MCNPWLAIDLSRDPRKHASILRRAWEAYLSDGIVQPVVRSVVMQSWQRSAAGGASPENVLAPVVHSLDEVRDLWQEHPISRIMPVIHDLLTWLAEEAGHLVVVSDAEGHLLSIEGNRKVRDWAEQMQFVPGAKWSEEAAGTNAIGTALAFDHPVQIFAAEHFSQHVHNWTCSAAPIHDPATGEVLGVIDLTSKLHTVHPHSLALVAAAARAAEAALKQNAEMLAAHRDKYTLKFLTTRTSAASHPQSQPVLRMNALGRDQISMQIGAQQFSFSRRHSEILTLLAHEPAGLSSDRLSVLLYGDLGNPITVRAEMSRLRKILGPWLETNPYRLALPVEADFLTLEHLLKRGNVYQALELYRGPLLPGSGAPGIAEIREQLEVWLRQAILTRREPELLHKWVETGAGRDDLEAWEILLGRLDRQDPLVGKVLARVYQLQ